VYTARCPVKMADNNGTDNNGTNGKIGKNGTFSTLGFGVVVWG